jgi:hypothetical protein
VIAYYCALIGAHYLDIEQWTQILREEMKVAQETNVLKKKFFFFFLNFSLKLRSLCGWAGESG